MGRWQVQITGHAFDLGDLPAWFTDPRLRVVSADGAFYLEADRFDDLDSSAEVHAAARDLVRQINGVAKLANPSFRDVDVGSAVRELHDPGPHRQHVVLVVDTVEVRSKADAVIVKVGEEEPEPLPPGSRPTDAWLRIAGADQDAREAITLWAEPHTWVSLYKVCEIVRARVDIVSAGLASRNELSLFTRTANNQAAAGAGARHARATTQPPSQPMTLHEAEVLLTRILTGWMDSLT